MSLYAWLMLASFLGPFILSFDKKVAYYKIWIPLFVGILVNGALFILWDGWFTRIGVWSFNPDYVWPIRINDLPIEEWSFFFVVPYASVFIYCCIKAYFSDQWLTPYVDKINFFGIAVLLVLCIVFKDKTYTLVNCAIALLLLVLHHYVLKKQYMAYFWIAYLVHLIPFFVVNGVLTAVPVVKYNHLEIIGQRLYTIPVEDTIYAFTCLLLPITIMEWLSTKKNVA